MPIVLDADPSTTGARWRLRFDERPFTANQERRWHHHRRAEAVRRWREAFAVLAREAKLPSLTAVEVTATPLLTSRRGLQDVGGCFPAGTPASTRPSIAALALADDGPDHLHATRPARRWWLLPRRYPGVDQAVDCGLGTRRRRT
jgi:hypothetical protein